MMSLETIESESRNARERASVNHTVPFIVEQCDIDAWQRGEGMPFPFPFIGDYSPRGYTEFGDALFIDTSGMGADDEPALSVSQMLDELQPGLAYAFTECGQFQAYLQPFRVVKYRHAKNAS